MKFKRFAALILALLMCTSLCSCGKGTASSPEQVVEKYISQPESVEELYRTIGIDIKQSLQNEIISEGYLILAEYPQIIKDISDSTGWYIVQDYYDYFDEISAIIGEQTLRKYYSKLEAASSAEEQAEIVAELCIKYTDIFLQEFSVIDGYEQNPSDSSDISVIKLEGNEYSTVLKELSDFVTELSYEGAAMMYTPADVNEIYAVSSITLYIDGAYFDQYTFDFDDYFAVDNLFVLGTPQGYFMYLPHFG